MKASTLKIQQIMSDFAERTGLTGALGLPRRYLWTDAFAVCNYLELFRRTEDSAFLELATVLVDQVHRVLGRHRDDDFRLGWISGLGEEEGQRHPTCGGLRIGKPGPERAADEPVDEQAEWDQDGQYYHYLTKWMHALNRMAQVTGQPHYRRWAIELARVAHRRFVCRDKDGLAVRMFWKMSIDLSRPLVSSMGQHDPLDGLLTCWELHSESPVVGGGHPVSSLDREIDELTMLCDGCSWQTGDPLGIGGLLTDACRLAQLLGRSRHPEPALLPVLLQDALVGLEYWVRQRPLEGSASRRLAFRELGLAIGVHAVVFLREVLERQSVSVPAQERVGEILNALLTMAPLAEEIEEFWSRPDMQQSPGWAEHRDINEVMLATSLGPDAYLLVGS